MATPGKNPNRADLLRALGWDVRDTKSLLAFLHKPQHLESYILFHDEWMEKRAKGVRGLNEDTIVNRALTAITKRESRFDSPHRTLRAKFTELDYHVWFIIAFVRYEQYPDGVWNSKKRGDLPELLRIANLFLRHMKCTKYYEKAKQLLKADDTDDETESQSEQGAPEDEDTEIIIVHDYPFLYGEGNVSYETANRSISYLIPRQKNNAESNKNQDLLATIPSDAPERKKFIADRLDILPLNEQDLYHKLMRLANCAGNLVGNAPEQVDETRTENGEDLRAEHGRNYVIAQVISDMVKESEVQGQAFAPLKEVTPEEIERFNAADKLLDSHSSKVAPFFEACDYLEIEGPDAPHLPGMSISVTLLKHQVAGIHWIIIMLQSPMQSALLADAMGLGKTFQALGALSYAHSHWEGQAVEQERPDPKGSGQNDKPQWLDEPSIILCPLYAISHWEDHLRRLIPQFNVVTYTAKTHKHSLTRDEVQEMGRNTILLTSPQLLVARHGSNTKQRWVDEMNLGKRPRRRKGLPNPVRQPPKATPGNEVTSSDWPYDLSEVFFFGILDEAHNYKDLDTQIHLCLRELKIRYRVSLTGTPVINRPDEDLSGVIGLLEPGDLYDILGLDKKICDPFGDYDHDDNRRYLVCTQTAVDKIKKTEDVKEKARLIKKIYDVVMLRRTYQSMYEGELVVPALPGHRKVQVSLEIQKDLQDRMAAIMSKNRQGLFVRPRGGGRIIMKADKTRQMAHCATWIGFDKFEESATECNKFRDGKHDLKDLLQHMVNKTKDKDAMGFDVRELDGEDLLMAIAKHSPKIRYLCFLYASIVLILGTKMVGWLEYPWPLLLIEKVMEYAGCDIRSLHAGMKDDKRNASISEFNDLDDTAHCLLINYKCGATALNLQKKCHFTIIIEPALSSQQQEQAIFRLRRIGQENIQITIILYQRGTFNEWQLENHKNKAFAEFMAYIKKVETSEGGEEDILDEDEWEWQGMSEKQVEDLWSYLIEGISPEEALGEN